MPRRRSDQDRSESMSAYVVGVAENAEGRLRPIPLDTLRARSRLLSKSQAAADDAKEANQGLTLQRIPTYRMWLALCDLLHDSAAASRREIDGCEWKNHSTHFDGTRSARF